MGDALSQELLALVFAGAFGSLIGWYLRQVVREPGATERARRDRELAMLQGRLEVQMARVDATDEELKRTRDELGDRERHVRELEGDLAVHARISERALRADDELATLREEVRRAEAARKAADEARALIERDLVASRVRVAECERELSAVGVRENSAEIRRA